jgi:membrane protein
LEEKPLDHPATHPDLSPEARRRQALQRYARRESQTEAGTRILAVARRIWTGTYYDGFIHAGNLAYMSILALFPFFIAIAAIFAAIGEPTQRDASIDAFLAAVPPIVAHVIEPVARGVVAARSGWLLWAGGAVGIWTSTSLLETIRDILHRAYGTPPTQAFWRHRLISTGVILVAAILLLLSLIAQFVIVAVQQVISERFPSLESALAELSLSRLATAGVLYCSILLLFITLTPNAYRGRPYPKWPGALLVTLWWVTTATLLPGVLRMFFTYDLTYGSLAGVMIALFFFWLIGLGIVIGAELNAALAVSPEERALRERTDHSERDTRGTDVK